MKFKPSLLASSALLAAIFCAPAHAQTSAGGGATTIEELVVTAEKREQSLQDVPIAASQRNNSATVASDRFANGGQNLELTPPRTYGVELQYRF